MIAALVTFALLAPAERSEHVEVGLHATAIAAPWNDLAAVTIYSAGLAPGASARLVFIDTVVVEASAAAWFAMASLQVAPRIDRDVSGAFSHPFLGHARLTIGWRFMLDDDLAFTASLGPSADLVPSLNLDNPGSDVVVGIAPVAALRWRPLGSLWLEVRAGASIGVFPQFAGTGDVGVSASWAFGKLQ